MDDLSIFIRDDRALLAEACGGDFDIAERLQLSLNQRGLMIISQSTLKATAQEIKRLQGLAGELDENGEHILFEDVPLDRNPNPGD